MKSKTQEQITYNIDVYKRQQIKREILSPVSMQAEHMILLKIPIALWEFP